MRVVILASGNGGNAEAIIKAQAGYAYEVVGLVSDQTEAKAIKRAEALGVETAIFDRQAYPSRQTWEEAIVAWCQEKGAELLILAGYMRIVGEPFLSVFANRMLNIHPSLLPAFKGKSAIKDAFEAGAQTTGVTVHLVDEGMDTGPVLFQEALTVDPQWPLEELEEHIHEIEHQLYPRAIDHFCREHRRS